MPIVLVEGKIKSKFVLVKNPSEVTAEDITALHDAIGNKQTAAPGDRILEVVVLAGLADSNGQAKELIKSKSITLNDKPIDDMMYTLNESDFIG